MKSVVQEFQVLVLVIFSGFVSTVFIGDVCSPELMKVFKTLFAKRTRCQCVHVRGLACLCNCFKHKNLRSSN